MEDDLKKNKKMEDDLKKNKKTFLDFLTFLRFIKISLCIQGVIFEGEGVTVTLQPNLVDSAAPGLLVC